MHKLSSTTCSIILAVKIGVYCTGNPSFTQAGLVKWDDTFSFQLKICADSSDLCKSIWNVSKISVSEVIINLSWWQEFLPKVDNIALVIDSLDWFPQGCCNQGVDCICYCHIFLPCLSCLSTECLWLQPFIFSLPF